MTTITLERPQLALGAGYFFLAPLGSTLPAMTVAGSIFTDAWPAAWVLKGGTDKGTVLNHEVKATPIEAAEWYNPLQYETDGTETSLEGALLSITATNLKALANGGSIAVTGTGATTLNAFTPADPGSEIRQMLGWESRDYTERVIMEQVFQVGRISISRNKGGGNRATMPFKFMAEIPSGAGAKPFRYWSAGVARA